MGRACIANNLKIRSFGPDKFWWKIWKRKTPLFCNKWLIKHCRKHKFLSHIFSPQFTFACMFHQELCLTKFFLSVYTVLLATTWAVLFGTIPISLHSPSTFVVATLHQTRHIASILLNTLISLFTKNTNPPIKV